MKLEAETKSSPDSITNLTIGAGFFILFTTVISLGFRVFRAFTADCRAGMASARSFSQSSLYISRLMIKVKVKKLQFK